MKKIFLFLLLFFVASPSFSLGLRNQGDMFLGLTGGYGFPQLQTGKDASNTSLKSTDGKDYFFGLSYGIFALDHLALKMDLNYNYSQIEYKISDSYDLFVQRYLGLNLQAQYYWMEFLYLGGGFFAKFPWGDPSFNDSIKNSSLIYGGALIEGGVDMRFFDPFALRIGLRFNFPFTPSLSVSHNNFEFYTFPIEFVFSLEYVF